MRRLRYAFVNADMATLVYEHGGLGLHDHYLLFKKDPSRVWAIAKNCNEASVNETKPFPDALEVDCTAPSEDF